MTTFHEDKQTICDLLCETLKATRGQNDVKALKYEILDNDDERVTIEYEHGGSRLVNVSMDSGVAMIRDIMRACE